MSVNKFVFVLCAAVLVITMVGCDTASDSANVNVETAPTEVVNYGNNVYYLPHKQAGFGNALSRFINEHPDLELIALTGNGTGAYGEDSGYFAVFRKINPQ